MKSIATARAECREKLKMITAAAKLERLKFNEQLKADVARKRKAANAECACRIKALKTAKKDAKKKAVMRPKQVAKPKRPAKRKRVPRLKSAKAPRSPRR